MPVSAAQLQAEVKITGADQAKASLLGMGAASDAVDASLASVAEAATITGGYLATLGNQIFTTGVGVDGLAMSADAATVGMDSMAAAVDIGALSFEEFIAYSAEADIALGLVTEATGMAADMARGLAVSMDGVVVSADATTTSLAGTNIALADTSVRGASTSASLDGVAASEEAVGVASSKVALGLGVLALAAVVAAGAAVKMDADYQQSMLKVQSLTGASTEQMNQFDAGLKQLSMDTGVAPKKLSDGLYNVISAGYQGKDAMTVLALATKDAVIGMTDAKTTTDALTNVMASFNMKAKDATRVNGEMLETVTLGKSTFEQYANSIVKSASASSQFHESMETMNAAFATMTSSGIKAAQASTDYQQSLKVMDGNIGAVTKSLSKNGIAFDETKFNTMDYGHKVVYLNQALDEANQKHVKVTGVTLQAAQAIQTIAQHIDTYNKDLSTLSDRQAMAQKTQEAWAVTQQGFNVSLQRLQATFQVVMIDLGQKLLPIATGGINLLNDAFQGLMSSGSQVGAAFSQVGTALSGFNAPLQNIASLIKGELSKEFKDLGTDVQQVGTWFMSSVVPALKQALPGFESLGKTILTTVIPAIIQIRGVFVDVIQNALQKFGPIIGQIIPPLIQFAGILAKDVADGLKFIMPYILDATKAIGNFANEIMDRVAPIIQQWIKSLTPLVEAFMRGWNTGWPVMAGVLKSVWDMIVGIVKVAWALVSGIIKIGLDILGGNWKQAWEDFKTMLAGVWDGIKTYLHGAWEGIRTMVGAAFGQLGTDALNAGANIVKQIASGITGAIHFVSDAISTVTNWISAHLPHSPAKEGPLRDLQMQGGMITQQIGEGMLANMPKLNAALGQLVKPISMTLSPGGIAALPAGTSGIPASISQSALSPSGTSNQPLIVNVHVAGHNVAQAIIPDITTAIRYSVGGLGM